MNKNMTIPLSIGMVAVSSLVAYFSAQMSTKAEISQVSERTAKVEVIIPKIESDVRDIKDTLKSLDAYVRQNKFVKNVDSN